MRWGWINVYGIIIIALLLVPNIIYAVKGRGEGNLCENRLMNILEQTGRYGCMLCMVFPFVRGLEFGFASVGELLFYSFGNILILSAYWIIWIVYFCAAGVHNYTARVNALKWALVILPCCEFLLCGITLRYALLTFLAVVFSIGHIFVTRENILKSAYTEER